jgi:glycyl-tRNA synthetase
MVGLDTTIIMNPKVWEASGHLAGFNDPMVDCRGCKSRFRADHLIAVELIFPQAPAGRENYLFTGVGTDKEVLAKHEKAIRKLEKAHGVYTRLSEYHTYAALNSEGRARYACPECEQLGTLTEPRQFNLMFETYVGAVQDDESKAYLRPETAQGIFCNFWNVVDTGRVRIPFGIAQQGKAFRNEVTPRNFTFRSREFEQMEIEFFIHPSTANEWYAFWRRNRYEWWQSIGLTSGNLQLREHEKEELAHYARDGAGVCDIEYRFPFTAPGFGELEGVAHRADFDLKAHAEKCGKGDRLRYFDQERREKGEAEGSYRYFPHVIEPSAGADRGTLALICEAFTPDPSRPSGVVMKFHPRMAPIKAAVYPLVNKNGMPEVAEQLYRRLRTKWSIDFDPKQSIGKRYARMDEAGTPFCFTIDGQTLRDQTVTVRHRDTQQQERLPIDSVELFLAEKLGTA